MKKRTTKIWTMAVASLTGVMLATGALAGEYVSPTFHLPDIVEEAVTTDLPAEEIQETEVQQTEEVSPALTETPAPAEEQGQPEATDVPAAEEQVEPEATEVPSEEEQVEPETTEVPSEEEQGKPEVTDMPVEKEQGEPEITDMPVEEEKGEPETTDVPSEQVDIPETTDVPEQEPETPDETEEQTKVSFERDENGNLILDERGNPVPVLNAEDDIPVAFEKDENGNLILDENGNPIVLRWLPAGSTVWSDQTDQLDPNRSVRLYMDIGKKDVLYYGDVVNFYAVLNGYDNAVYELRWQESADTENWVDIPGENGLELAVVLSEDNATHYWRVVVDVMDIIPEDEIK